MIISFVYVYSILTFVHQYICISLVCYLASYILLLGLSDPYCVLGLVELDASAFGGRKKTRHLRDLVDDDAKLYKTKTIRESLNPSWNEEFEL